MSELAKALTAFHSNLPEVGKGSTNPAFHSRYADLADIVKVVLPALAAQGLAWTALPTMTAEGFVLVYRLTHTSGEQLEGSWPLPEPAKATAQQLGSAVTYAKRYTLSAVTGIAPDEDDDGNAASAAPGRGKPRQAPRTPAPDRTANVIKALEDATTVIALDGVWERVKQSGLDGVAEIKKAYEAKKKDMPETSEEAAVDHWATAAVPS